MSLPNTVLCGVFCGALLTASAADAQIRVVLNEGDTLPGMSQPVSGLGIPIISRQSEPILTTGGNNADAIVRVGPTRGLGHRLVASGDPAPDGNRQQKETPSF